MFRAVGEYEWLRCICNLRCVHSVCLLTTLSSLSHSELNSEQVARIMEEKRCGIEEHPDTEQKETSGFLSLLWYCGC